MALRLGVWWGGVERVVEVVIIVGRVSGRMVGVRRRGRRAQVDIFVVWWGGYVVCAIERDRGKATTFPR